LGAGTLFGIRIMPEAYEPMVIFVLPAGAFMTLGFIIAVVQKIRNTVEEKRRLATIDENRHLKQTHKETNEEEEAVTV
jgi:hypothetical protein